VIATSVMPLGSDFVGTAAAAASEAQQKNSANRDPLADRGYNADWIRGLVAEQGPWANIPPT
jgi:hypothetical protein